jgi:TRAP transporter TAXI family solute receptor
MRPQIAAFALGLSFLIGAGTAQAQDPCTKPVKSDSEVTQGAYSIWTGPLDGYYEKVGQALTYSAKHAGLTLHPVKSNGSVDNICALEQGNADFALVQSDAAHLAWYGESPFTTQHRGLTLVTPVFVEKVHILVRPHLYIASPAGLSKPHSVWMGPADSGSWLSAQLVLLASGKSRAQIDELKATLSRDNDNFPDALALLQAWKLDAIFETEVAPSDDIANALKQRDYELGLMGLGLPSAELLSQNGMYIETSLQKSEYPQVDGQLYTVGVETLLLTRSDPKIADAVSTLAKTMRDRGSDIITHLQWVVANTEKVSSADPSQDTRISWGQSRQLTEPQSLSLLGTKVPKGIVPDADKITASFLWAFAIPKEAALRILILIIAFGLVICAAWLHPTGRRFAGRNIRPLLFLAAFGILFTIGGVSMQVVEGGLNSHFTTLLGSCISLGENIIGKLPIPFPNLPTPTSQRGLTLMAWSSWIGFLLLTGFVIPLLKKLLPENWAARAFQFLVGKT